MSELVDGGMVHVDVFQVSVSSMKTTINELNQIDKIFTLIVKFSSNSEELLLDRSFADIKVLARSLKKKRVVSESDNHIPNGKFKNLMKNDNWILNGENWEDNMKRSLAGVDMWLNWAAGNEEEFAIFIDENAHIQRKHDFIHKRISLSKARSLQQYLSSPHNIELLIQYTISGGSNYTDTIYIEPSCGDGRVMMELTNQLGGTSLSTSTSTIYGCDIDIDIDMVIKTKEMISHNEIRNAHVMCGNYLKCNIYDICANNNNNNNQISIDIDNRNIIVFGNPPYTICNIENNSNIVTDIFIENSHDYPLLFLVHSANIINASRIVLILPSRCEKNVFIECVLNKININNRKWICRTIPLINNIFDLSTITVQQPSILQVWSRDIPEISTI